MLVAPLTSIRPPQITQPIKLAVLLYRTHRLRFHIIIRRKAWIILNRCTCILGRQPMLSICNRERSSLQPFSFQMKCATKFWPATKSLIWSNQHQIQVNIPFFASDILFFIWILCRRSQRNWQLPFAAFAGTIGAASEIAASVIHVQSHTRFVWIQILSSTIAR